MQKIKDKIKQAQKTLSSELNRTNPWSLPRLVKVVVSSGTGKAKDKKRNELVADRLAKITGQRASERGAKKSIASFKVRQGDIVGYAITLRGQMMNDFLDRLLNVAIPRLRDFKGFDEKIVDQMGNLTIGIKEHVVFPETADEDIRDVFGLAITINTTARQRGEALAFFRSIGFPFKKTSARK